MTTQCNGSIQLDADGNVVDPRTATRNPAPQHTPGARVNTPQQHDGSYQSGNDTFRPNGPASYDTIKDRPQTGILDTATNTYGAPVSPQEVNGLTLVRLPSGIQCSADDAVRLGYLQRTLEGYVDPVTGAAATPPKSPAPADTRSTSGDDAGRTQQQQSPQTDTDPAPLPVPSEVAAVVAEAAAHGAASKALLDSYLNDGEPSADAIADMAQRLGADPSKVVTDFERVRSALTQQAAQAVAKLGIDADAVFQWASAQPPDSDAAKALRKAVERHATRGEAHHYSRVASLFFAEQVRHHPAEAMQCSVLQDSGLEILRENPTGPVLLRLQNGMVVPLADALAEGVIALR